MREYKSEKDVLIRAKEAEGKSFGEIDKYGRLNNTKNKGGYGQLVEESWFEYKVNSNAEPDFKEAGVELKVTPFKENKTEPKYSAKERLVLNVIDFEKEYQYSFETSSFWKKNKVILLMWYLYMKDKLPKDFVINYSMLFKYSENDLKIIRSDWDVIVEKIKNGLAHEISEADTMYLAACPKGSNKETKRRQPFSNIMAMQRAFSLKQSYMTRILRTYMLGKEEEENVIKDAKELEVKRFEEIIIDKLKIYYGKTQEQIKNEFGVTSTAKNINELLLERMLSIKGKISKVEEFQKANIEPKTIRIDKNGKIREHMSFPTFEFQDIINEEWETSELRNRFESTKFLFIIFRFNLKDELVFEKAMFWRMPNCDLDEELKKVWEKTKKTISDGVILIPEPTKIKGKLPVIHNNLPKSTENRVSHVRPHASHRAYEKSPYASQLPDGRWMPKQCFWLNSSYILEQIQRINFDRTKQYYKLQNVAEDN